MEPTYIILLGEENLYYIKRWELFVSAADSVDRPPPEKQDSALERRLLYYSNYR